jgi:hypothetical protein
MQQQSIHLVASVAPGPSEPNGPAEVSFQIENTGESSRHCVVTVAGLPAAWYALDPHDILLAPGASSSPRLTVRPPQTALGRYSFTVSARTDDANVVEALSFTLVMSAGGAMRVYPGLVMMQAGTAVTAETTGAVVAARPKIPRLLFLAAPLLLLLLLLGAALSKQSPRATRTAAAPVLSPTATPAQRAGAGLATPTATDAGTGAFGDSSGTPPPTIPGEAQTVTAAEMVIASKPRSSPPVPVATSVARAVQATRQSAEITPAAHPVQADVGQQQSAQAVSRQPSSTPVGAARPEVTPVAVAMTRPTPAAETRPIVSSASTGGGRIAATGVRHTAASKPMYSVAGVVRAHAPRQTYNTRIVNMRRQVTTRQVTTRQVTTGQVHQVATYRRVVAHAPAQSRRRQPARSSYRRAQTGQPQARHAIIARRSSRRYSGAARQGQHRVIQHSSIVQRHQQQSAARRTQQRTVARRALVTKVAAARTGSALRVTWPAHAILYFDHPDALRLATAPGASIAVTLQTIIRTRGVGGRELTLPYHTTTYATADRYGRVSIPLRYAYVPAQPTPATLIVVAHTAYGVSRRSASITLTR